MKSFSQSTDVLEIQTRLAALEPNSPRQWGKMNSHQAICHLIDAFNSVSGNRVITPPPMPNFLKPLLKWLALYSGLAWAKGAPTAKENDQEKQGTTPKEFAADKAVLLEWIRRVSANEVKFVKHSLFGNLSAEEWQRWAYLHCDHHLRQFGV